MTDEQNELVCRIKLSLLKAIVNLDDQMIWNHIVKVIQEDKNEIMDEGDE